jgi:hypothetical protein
VEFSHWVESASIVLHQLGEDKTILVGRQKGCVAKPEWYLDFVRSIDPDSDKEMLNWPKKKKNS